MPAAPASNQRVRVGLCALVLLLATTLLYLPSAAYDFVEFDDAFYIGLNPALSHGLSWSGVSEAFLTATNSLWIPVTSLSFLVDMALHGPTPAGFHVTGIFLHAVASVLCFQLLWRYTGMLLPSLTAAALWAAHPLRVESVAWISGRKDILALIFLAWSLLCHLRFARTRRRGWLAAVWLTFAMGLMAKPSLTTAPALFLILDYWPLSRFREQRAPDSRAWRSPPARLVLEKVPLFLLAFVATALAGLSIHGVPAAWPTAPEMMMALGRAASAPWVYLRQTIGPFDLGLRFAPPAVAAQVAKSAAAVLALVIVTAVLVGKHRKLPCLVAGWLWYLVALLPVSGIVPTGNQWLADRYTYLPHLGLAVALVWGGRELSLRRRWPPGALATLAAAAVIVLALFARHQMPVWRDSISLFSRAVALAPHDSAALNNLGSAYGSAERYEEALSAFRRAETDTPGDVLSRFNIGLALERLGRSEEAVRAYQEVLAVGPDDAPTHLNLGRLLLASGYAQEGVKHLAEFIRISDDPAEVALVRAEVEAASAKLRSGKLPPRSPEPQHR